MALYGRIIRVFDETSILINLGNREGVKQGDRFVVIEKAGEVTDPDSGESLGELELVKAELSAADVQERMSILKTETVQDSHAGLPLSARMVQASVRSSTSGVRMAVTPGDLSGYPATTPVRTGDTVRRVE